MSFERRIDPAINTGAVVRPLQRLTRADAPVPTERQVAVEAPISIEINGLGYAVLMATPQHVEDLIIGFMLSERLADRSADIADLDIHSQQVGHIARVTLSPHIAHRVVDRVRHRVSDSACGLCGIENLEQAMRPLPMIERPFRGRPDAVFAALEGLADRQRLNRQTGSVHAAALCDTVGKIRVVREDVGRHNAFDKLIGAMARQHLAWDGGFALLSSRCSFELVEKAVIAGCPLLATISAPTSLALDRAASAGLPLVSLARSDSMLFAPS